MIELAGVIRDLRGELERALVAGAGEALQFELGPIELEVQVALERSEQGGGTVRFWVVDLNGDRTHGVTDTQRIKLLLTPRLDGGAGSAFVSGRAAAGEE